MKRFALVLALLLLATTGQAATVYYRTALTGGAATALDGQDGAALDDADLAIVADGTDIYHLWLDADSGAAESSPSVISPDTNAGTKRWLLQNVYSVTSGVTPPSGVELTGGIAGMTLSNAADTEHDISVSAGACMDSTGVYLMSGVAAVVKQIDATWAAGTGAGGLLNGSVGASELYNVYAFRKDADGTVDYGFLDDDDDIATYKPAGYTYYRWIGFAVTDASSNILNFTMTGDIAVYKNAWKCLTGVSAANLTVQDLSNAAPTNRTVQVLVGANNSTGSKLYWGPNATEGESSVNPIAGTTWLGILDGSAAAPLIQWVTTTPGGDIYIDDDNTSTDIWIKSVKIVR